MFRSARFTGAVFFPALILCASLIVLRSAAASTVPAGFQELTVISGLTQPTAVRFAPNGNAFVAQKDGRLYTYDSVTDSTPTLVIDLRSKVFNGWDRPPRPRRGAQELGITTIYVTHDQEEALSLSDRIAVINLGKLQQIGTPLDLYEKPECPFVADFIGINNLIPGEVQWEDPTARVGSRSKQNSGCSRR